MNRRDFGLLVTLCSLTVGAYIIFRSNMPMAGGYTTAPVTDDDVIKAAEFAISAQSETIQQPGKLQMLKILRAEQQVVAGVNYRLTLSVVDDGNHQRIAEVIVWWQAWRSNPYELTSWTWK